MLNRNTIQLSTIKKYRAWIMIGKLIMVVSVLLPLSNPKPGCFIMEEWKDVIGYDGDYIISNHGIIRSFKMKSKGKVLKQFINNKGYLQLGLCKNGIPSMHTVHRLIALAFIPNLYNKPEINHKDGIPLNNNITNMEWCTRSENILHAHRTGLKSGHPGEKNGRSKLNKSQVRVIRNCRDLTQVELGEIFNVTSKNIAHIKNYKSWQI